MRGYGDDRFGEERAFLVGIWKMELLSFGKSLMVLLIVTIKEVIC